MRGLPIYVHTLSTLSTRIGRPSTRISVLSSVNKARALFAAHEMEFNGKWTKATSYRGSETRSFRRRPENLRRRDFLSWKEIATEKTAKVCEGRFLAGNCSNGAGAKQAPSLPGQVRGYSH